MRKYDVLVSRVLEEKYTGIEAKDPEKAVTMVVDHLTSPNGSPSTPIGEAFVDHWDNLELSFQRFIAAEVVDDEFTSAYDFVLSDDGLIVAKLDSSVQEEKVKQILQEALVDHAVVLPTADPSDEYFLGYLAGIGVKHRECVQQQSSPNYIDIEYVGRYDALVKVLDEFFKTNDVVADAATIALIRPIQTKESEHEQKS